MARPRKSFPDKVSVVGNKVRIWWNGRYWHLGTADNDPGWRAELARLRALWTVDPNAVPARPDDYLISDLCGDYMQSKDSPQESHQRDRARLAIRLLADLHPETTVAAFGPVMLRAWQDWLCRLTNAGGSSRFNVTTINYHVDTIRRVWRWGVSTERVPEERAAALATVPRPKVGSARPPRVIEPADPDHVRATLPYLLVPVRAMVVLQLAAGARPGELCRLTPGAVIRSGKLHVPGAGVQDLDKLGVWAHLPIKHKGSWRGKPRYLVFGPDAQAVLEPFLSRGADVPCFSPAEAVAELRERQRAARTGQGSRKAAKAAPARAPGSSYSPRAYRHAVAKAAERAGVPHWFPYQLRHAAAAELKEVYELDAVQALLGHHTKSMTEHYGGVAFRKAAEVARGRSAG